MKKIYRKILRVRKYFIYVVRLIIRPSRIRNNRIILPVEKAYLSHKMRKVLYSSNYENHEYEIVKKYLESNDIVLEIGTGIGYITTVCAKKIGSEKVTSFEANHKIIPMIKKTFDYNNVSPNLLHGLVTKTSNQEREFHTGDDYWASSIIRRENQKNTSVIKTVGFEDISNKNFTFLILDIEGAEKDFIGLKIPGNIKKILIEFHESIIGRELSHKVYEWIISQGFTVVVNNGLNSANYFQKK